MKTNIQKKILIGILMFSLVAMYGLFPTFNAKAVDSIHVAQDLISDSDLGQTANHDFTFTTTDNVPNGGYIQVNYESSDWGAIPATSNVTCPASTTAATTLPDSHTARCTYATGLASGTQELLIDGVTNPATSSTYYISIEDYTSSDTLIERVTVAVRIIDDIWMTATVDSSLTFNIYGTSTSAVINGIPCSNTSTATDTPFGTLQVDATSTVCQTLKVTTNANNGYIVTVQEDQELTSDSGANINSFDNSQDGTGTTTARAWEAPKNILDNYHTYGHMGLTSDDQDLFSLGGGNDFYNSGNPQFAGLNGTDPMMVMQHNGPSDGITQNKGVAHVLYQAEIGSLQEAGDYENTLTYICTPTF